jgi:hypothetical protein
MSTFHGGRMKLGGLCRAQSFEFPNLNMYKRTLTCIYMLTWAFFCKNYWVCTSYPWSCAMHATATRYTYKTRIICYAYYTIEFVFE